MNKKQYLLIIGAIILVSFLAITVYKAYFEKGNSKTEQVADEDEDEKDDDEEDSNKDNGYHDAEDGDRLVECDLCHVNGNVPGICGVCNGTAMFNGMMCPICSGTATPGKCYKCKGTGYIPRSKVGHDTLPLPVQTTPTPPLPGGGDRIECPACYGTKNCAVCAGNGYIIGYNQEHIPCSSCHQGGLCSYCNGRGYVY